MTAPIGFACLYFGDPCECRNCGGCVTAEGGPFPGDSRYCSEDCYADAQQRSAAISRKVTCCPECGYDREEHRPDCSLIPEGCGKSWAPASLDAEGIPAHLAAS